MRLVLLAVVFMIASYTVDAATPGSVSGNALQVNLEGEGVQLDSEWTLAVQNYFSSAISVVGDGPTCATWAADMCDYYGFDVSTPTGLAAYYTFYGFCHGLTGEPEQ